MTDFNQTDYQTITQAVAVGDITREEVNEIRRSTWSDKARARHDFYAQNRRESPWDIRRK